MKAVLQEARDYERLFFFLLNCISFRYFFCFYFLCPQGYVFELEGDWEGECYYRFLNICVS